MDPADELDAEMLAYSPAELEAALTNAGFVDAKVEATERFFVLGHARHG